jgi:hypothetical protein
MYRIETESQRFRDISRAICNEAYPSCVDLSVIRFCYENKLVHTDALTGDAYVLSDDLQWVSDVFSSVCVSAF